MPRMYSKKNFDFNDEKPEVTEAEGLNKGALTQTISVETALIIKEARDIFAARTITDLINLLQESESKESEFYFVGALNELVSVDTLDSLRNISKQDLHVLIKDPKHTLQNLMDLIKSEAFTNFKRLFERSFSPGEQAILDRYASESIVAKTALLDQANLTNYLKKAPKDIQCLDGMAGVLGDILKDMTKELSQPMQQQEEETSPKTRGKHA